MKNDLFKHTQVPHWILSIGAASAVFYLLFIWIEFTPSNPYLFTILIGGQIFLVWQVLTYIHTIWNTETTFPRDESYLPHVDVYITVAGEPLDIVEETVRAAVAMEYPDFTISILNDGFVANKENWREVEMLAKRLGVGCITRQTPGGAKAGNINHAIGLTSGPFIAIFDTDHVPYPTFLKRLVPYFADTRVAFVQTPQYYKNKDENYIAKCSWEQQELFFGPICKGKNAYNAATMCGTNMIIRRQALFDVGNMCEDSIAEDFVTGLFMHEKGWKSIYVPEILSEGLAPEDFLSYWKQQYRWARGALDVIFRYNLIKRNGLTLNQKIQYLSSASHFLSGIVVIVNALFPIIFLFTGQQPFEVSTMALAAAFLPYMFLTLYILGRSSGNTFTFNALAFSMGGFGIHISALLSALTRKKSIFAITSKRKVSGNFLRLVTPHVAYIIAGVVGSTIAIERSGFSPAVANNMAWYLISVAVFIPSILAAAPRIGMKQWSTATVTESPKEEMLVLANAVE